jgi:uncharacterized membrane protein YfcA
MNPINTLLGALVALNSGFLAYWGKTILASRKLVKSGAAVTPDKDTRPPTLPQVGVGFITNFFDTLGIGSYAPTTAFFKLTKMVNDRIIPGTMTVGHNLSTTVQTFLFVAAVPVDVTTLFSMIGSSIAGAWLGAGIVAKWPKRKIQIGMGIALLIAATVMFFGSDPANPGPFMQLTGMRVLPGGGAALGVSGWKLLLAVTVNFFLGALMTLGIGLYAPCMITIYLLGMNPRAAFPIMMGSCAFLMPVAAIPFLRERSFSNRPALGLLFGGIPGVLIAFYIVKSMPLEYLFWLVDVVVIYTAISMLRSAFGSEARSAARDTVEVEA